VAEGLERVRLAESVLRPQVGVSGLGYFIDKDRAVSSFGTQGQANLTGTAFASQLLYSESAGANVEIEKSFQLSREEEREQLRLDVVQAAASAYLSVLRAKAFEGISKQNLGRTRKNLEIARNRVRTGVASRAEVLRWKNEISTNRREVIRANALRNQAEMEVNRLLNRPLEESFRTEEAGLNDPVLLTSFTRISQYIGDPWSFRVFREFMVGEGIANSPELGRLDAKLQAQRRAVLSAERAFWAPTLGLQGDIGARASAGGGSLPPVEGFPEPGHVDWTVAVSLDFPLFTGGGRRAELAGARQELERMLLERESVAEVTEQKIRSALHGAGASFASIDLAQESLDSARQNLELVADSYRQGLVSIVELIDAQSSTLVSEQVAANAIYDYLVDLMNVQRAVGRFDFFASPAEQTEWLQRLETFFRQRNP
jgi:outer membrane protein TolC